jgi:1-acyl-sn-glycerol-3-phosphate acyltransferase
MSDAFYSLVRMFGSHPFWLSSCPVIIGVEKTARAGPYILASNHESPYEVPLLIRHGLRRIDFVSTTEVFRHPFVRWFYGSMNAFPLDRSQPDVHATRTIFDRLERGRVVGMFPEGRLRNGEHALVHTRKIRRGIGRIAKLARVPIMPAFVVNSIAYSRLTGWLPIRHTRYGVIFGDVTEPSDDPDVTERTLVETLLKLRGQLIDAMNVR